MAKRLFQQSLSDHCVSRSLSFGKVVAYSPRGSLSHKRICLLYSVFKELSAIQPIKINSSQIDFNRMTSEVAGKGEVPNFTYMYYITTISKFISISSNAV